MPDRQPAALVPTQHREFPPAPRLPCSRSTAGGFLETAPRCARARTQGRHQLAQQAPDEVAALMTALDLVIGPSTFPALFAGALGAPAWMLVTRHTTWKTLGTEHLPMLPGMHLIWRPRNVKWDGILETVAAELRGYSAGVGR